MDNWLLIIVAIVFIVCVVVGYARGFLKFDFPCFRPCSHL